MDEAEIRGLLLQYLTGASALVDLDRTLTSVVWNPESPASARDLANTIALRIDEFSSRECTEAELQSALRVLVTHYTVRVVMGTASTLDVPIANSSQASLTSSIVFGTRPAVVPS